MIYRERKMKTIAKVTEEERRKIEYLIEKRTALSNLKKILENDMERKELFRRCVAEYGEIEKAYDQWWDSVIEKYQIIGEEEIMVDFLTGEIQVN